MPISSFPSEEVKRAFILHHGLNPDQFDVDEAGGRFVPKAISQPNGAPETTTDLQQKPSVKNTPTMLESAARSAAESALPTAASLGAIAGTLALMPEPVVTKLGALGTGALALLAGTAGGIGASALQKKVVPQDIQEAIFSTPESLQAHPYASIAGGFVPSTLAFNPVSGLRDLPTLGRGVMKLPQVMGPVGRTALTAAEEQALLNASFNTVPAAGMNIYEQMQSPDEFSVGQLLASSLPGIAFTRPHGIGKLMGFEAPPPEQLIQRPSNIETTTRPVTPTQELTPEQLLSAQGMPYERQVERRPRISSKTLQELEQLPFSKEGLKYRDEAKLDAEAQARLEGEGGIVPEKEQSPPQDLVEEMGRLREDLDAKTIELNNHRKQIEEQNKVLRDSMRNLDERQSGEAVFQRDLKTQLDALTPEQQLELENYLRSQARRRGFNIKQSPEIINEEGKSIAGRISGRDIELSTSKQGYETTPHEAAGHGFLDDLLRSSSPKDRQLGLDALNIYGGRTGKRFSTPEEWFNYTRSNPQEAFRAQDSIEEMLARDIGGEGLKQGKTSLYGTKREKMGQWWEGAKARWKREFNLSNDEDVRRHLVQRYRGDAPYGTRPEFLQQPTGKVVTQQNGNEESQKQGQEEGSVLSREASRESSGQDSSVRRIPIKIKDSATGKETEGEFTGYYDLSDIGRGVVASVGRRLEDGQMSHGMLKQGEEMVGEGVPTFEEWKAGLKGRESGEADYPRSPQPFELEAEKQLRTAEPFGVKPDKDGMLPGNTVLQRLPKHLTALEQQLLKDAGLHEFLGYKKRTPEEIGEWIKENGPKVEVHSYGMEGKVSEAKRAYDLMQHEFYDSKSYETKQLIRDVLLEQIDSPETLRDVVTDLDDNSKRKIVHRNDEKFLADLWKYKQLHDSIDFQVENSGPRATSAYTQVSPKDVKKFPVQRVDVVIPQKERAATDTIGADLQGWEKGRRDKEGKELESPKWRQDNLHENLPNTLGWAAIQYETLPNGEKVAHLFEVQSRWGQHVRGLKERGNSSDPNDIRYLRQLGREDHPLLKDYNRLILKAAIEQARKEGATKIAISDAETAMMTEGHDSKSNTVTKMYKDGKYLPIASSAKGKMKEAYEKLKQEGWKEVEVISQEPGMRLNYDQILPKIAEELTGSKGEKVSFGEHKNASEGFSDTGFEVTGRRQRENLIFKNPDGFPKTDVSARVYDIKPVSSKLEKEPFSLTGRRFSEEAEYPASYSFSRLLTSRLDRVAEKLNTPTAREVTAKMQRANTERDILEGRVGNKIIAEMQQYSPEEVMRVREYRHELDNGFPKPFELTANEKELKANLDRVYKEIGQMVIDSGLQVKSGEKFRSMKLKPEGYQENMPSTKVLDAWVNTKPEAAEYDRLFVEHAMKKGKSREEATKILEDYKKAVSNAGVTPDTNFGAIRKVEGIGLPWALVEQNGIASARRYGKRVATDLSFFKHIQNDPRMLKALGYKDQYGKTVEQSDLAKGVDLSDVDYIGSAPEVIAAKRSIEGIDLPQNPVAQTWARIVGANIMQTGTALRNILALPTSVAPYYGVNPRSVMSAIGKMNERTARAFENNAIKASFKDFDAAGQFDGNPSKFINIADKYISAMRKYTGRDLSDKLEGLFSYSLGEELATKWFAMAKEGDIKARAMLNRFGTTVEGGVKSKFNRATEVTSDDIQRVAKEFTDVVRGSYSAGGLPSAAIEGPMAPFLALSRWSIERSNNFWKDAILPAKEGNWMPLLKATFASLLSGAAIEQLNELLSGRRGNDPTSKEVVLEGRKEDLIAKGIGLLQMGALGGIVSDAMKYGSNVAQGKSTKFSTPISFPLASMVEDLGQKLTFVSQALTDGEDPMLVLGEFTKELLKSQSQNARYVAGQLDPEVTRKEKFRDLRIFKELQGNTASGDSGTPNPFADVGNKRFKKEENLETAISQLPSLIDEAVKKSGGNYEKLKKELEGLKKNSYQTFPSLTESPMTASEYYDYLVRTQGKEQADKRLQEFMEIGAKNKIKSSLVPNL